MLFHSLFDAVLGRRLVGWVILIPTVLASGCASVPDTQVSRQIELASQRQSVVDFYNKVIELGVFGLPTDEQLQALAPLISLQLLALLREARATQAQALANQTQAQPPLIQGALFFSLFEGASRVDQVKPATVKDSWQVTLVYGQEVPVVRWTDRVWLVNEQQSCAGRWVINDIEFNGQWDFSRQQRLTQTLRTVTAQAIP